MENIFFIFKIIVWLYNIKYKIFCQKIKLIGNFYGTINLLITLICNILLNKMKKIIKNARLVTIVL